MKKNNIIVFLALLFYTTACKAQGYRPKEGFISTDTIAIKIADIIWVSIYGNQIERFKPFKASLDQSGEIWTVTGTMPKSMFGGTPILEIQKADGKIVFVSHGK